MFIGFDLLYEWIVEVRHKLLLSEYIVLLATFFAIQFLGINGKCDHTSCTFTVFLLSTDISFTYS